MDHIQPFSVSADEIMDRIDTTTRERDNLIAIARDASGDGKHDIAANHLRAAARRSDELFDLHGRRIELGIKLPEEDV